MPTTYFGSGQYQVSCNTCGCSHLIDSGGRDARVIEDTDYGRGANEIYAWTTARQDFQARCRACNAAARRNSPRRATASATMRRTALGLARTFGVEIECIYAGGTYPVQDALNAAGYTDWRVKYDGSLSSGGVEVVSPVLTGEAGIDAIRGVTRVLREMGATVNRTCGLHAHHGIRDLTVDDVKRAAKVWATNQGLIDGLVSPSRRDGANTYCARLSSYDLAEINRSASLRDIERGLRNISRYKTFNLLSYGRFGTVEIRQHQGTLDAEKIISWVRFGQALLDGTVTAGAAVENNGAAFGTLRAMFRALGDHLDETARTFLTGRAVEFGAAAV